MIPHGLLKTYIPFFLLCLFFVNKKVNILKFFQLIVCGLYLFVPVYCFVYLYGFNLFSLLSRSWRVWATPVSYCFFMVLIYEILHKKTGDLPYSVTLSFHFACLSGYLYEFPRYLSLQGWGRVIRFNRYSPFLVDYSHVSLIVILWLLIRKGFQVNKKTLLVVFCYGVFTVWYYFNFNYVQSLRPIYVWFFGVKLYWIVFLRLPTMLFLLALTQTLNKQIYKYTT